MTKETSAKLLKTCFDKVGGADLYKYFEDPIYEMLFVRWIRQAVRLVG